MAWLKSLHTFGLGGAIVVLGQRPLKMPPCGELDVIFTCVLRENPSLKGILTRFT